MVEETCEGYGVAGSGRVDRDGLGCRKNPDIREIWEWAKIGENCTYIEKKSEGILGEKMAKLRVF